MKLIRKFLAASVVALAPFAARAELMVCIDSAAGGFNYGTAQCVADNGAGDLIPVDSVITTAFALGGFTVETAFGEPAFGPGFGMALSTDGILNGSWIVAVAQTGLNFGNASSAPTWVGANFTGSASAGGSASYAVYLDDANRGLDAWGPVGTLAASGSGFGSSAGQISFADPFSLLAFVMLDSTSPVFYSTDLTINVPEPGTVALLGLALTGLALVRRRQRR